MHRILEECRRVLPAVLFFYLAFNLINYTQALMFHSEQIEPYPQILIWLAAAVVAKVMVLIDHLPMVRWLRKKPLVYEIFWKTFLYSAVTLLIRSGLRNHIEYALLPPFSWTRFWAIQIWYTALFLVFVTAREVVIILGAKKVHHMLFGKRGSS